MAPKPKKNYNRLALQGIDIDDMEFVKQFDLDPAVAYTPRINEVMLNRMYSKNVRNLISVGHPEGKAKAEAGRMRAEAQQAIDALLKA
jgi:hypothetical protein